MSEKFMFNTITLTWYIPLLNVTIILLGTQFFEILIHHESLSEFFFPLYKICLKSTLIEKHNAIYPHPTQGLHHFKSKTQTIMSGLYFSIFHLPSILYTILDIYTPKTCYFIALYLTVNGTMFKVSTLKFKAPKLNSIVLISIISP